MVSQRKIGIVISYITLMLNSVFGIFFTPFLIKTLGISEYGLYQLITSLAGYLVVMNFGTSVIVTRFISKYRIEKDDKAQANFLAMSIIVTSMLVLLTLGVGYLLSFGINGLFSNTLTGEELKLASQLYTVVIINISITIIANNFTGVILGYEKFAVSNLIKLSKVVIRIGLFVILLSLGYKSLAIVTVDLFITILIILFEIFYCFKKLNIKIKYYYFDRSIVWMVLTFSAAITLQAVINQVNQNVDRVILGSLTDTTTVAIYSTALIVFTMYNTIAGTIGTMYVPQATRMITKGANSNELTDLVIRPGRLQFMVAGAVVVGFILFGRNFIMIWVGKDFIDAYIIIIILMVPMTIPLIQNVCLAILDAQMKRLARSLILVGMAGINVILTIIFVKKYGYIGAAIGSSIAVIFGDIIIMNFYYSKYIGLQVVRMFKEIFRGTMLSLLLTYLISLPIAYLLSDTFINFIVKLIMFCIIYIIILYKLSMNTYEKKLFLGILQGLLSKLRI